jgi:polysaccharide export outer membrane protein
MLECLGRRWRLLIGATVLAPTLGTAGGALGQEAFPSAVPSTTIAPAPSIPAPLRQATSASATPAAPPPSNDVPGALLGPADLLDISVYGVPELSQKVRINTSGDVYLPLIDYVHLGGLTTEEAQGVIEKRLADGGFVKSPHVVLFISESAGSSVSLLGEVAHPGIFNISGERRVLDLVSAAGGFTDRASRTITLTHRSDPTKTETVKLPPDLSPSNVNNVVVQPGDTMIVQHGPVFYVVGDVGKASGFVSDSENLTVLKAIALAGGANKTASMSGTTILRRTPTGTQQIKVPLKQIMRAKAEDMPMQSDDILFVPSSTRKVLAARSAEALTQMATGLSLVAIRP